MWAEKNLLFDGPVIKRFLFGMGKKKSSSLKDGAIEATKLKKMVEDIGVGKKVIVTRVGYEGETEDIPLLITSTHTDHFSGRIVNIDRAVMESTDVHLVYVKGGGGNVDYYYEDGDITNIEEDIDNEIIEAKDPEIIKELLEALEINDGILISFYHRDSAGMLNGMGKLIEKNEAEGTFSVALSRVNAIEHAEPKVYSFNIHKDSILDIQIQ